MFHVLHFVNESSRVPEPAMRRLGECEHRGCSEEAIGFNDDGEALCEDHLFEWATWFSAEPDSDPDGEFAEW